MRTHGAVGAVCAGYTEPRPCLPRTLAYTRRGSPTPASRLAPVSWWRVEKRPDKRGGWGEPAGSSRCVPARTARGGLYVSPVATDSDRPPFQAPHRQRAQQAATARHLSARPHHHHHHRPELPPAAGPPASARHRHPRHTAEPARHAGTRARRRAGTRARRRAGARARATANPAPTRPHPARPWPTRLPWTHRHVDAPPHAAAGGPDGGSPGTAPARRGGGPPRSRRARCGGTTPPPPGTPPATSPRPGTPPSAPVRVIPGHRGGRGGGGTGDANPATRLEAAREWGGVGGEGGDTGSSKPYLRDRDLTHPPFPPSVRHR